MQIVVDTHALNEQRKLLDSYSKRAFPRAIKDTLNSAAMDVKQNTMLKQTKKSFKGNREPNFFKSQSKVNFAKGTDIKTMQSMVGFAPHPSRPGSKAAIADLKEQEHGGNIKRPLLGTSQIRIGKSYSRKVRKEMTLQKLQSEGIVTKSGTINRSKVASAQNVKKARSKKAKFVRAAFAVVNTKGYMMSGNTLFKVNSISSNRKSKAVNLKATPLYTEKRGRTVRIKPTHFMEKASVLTHSKIGAIFNSHAEKAIKFYQK
jgi:hypothetical protein